jgi:hypothetical protein
MATIKCLCLKMCFVVQKHSMNGNLEKNLVVQNMR